VPTIKQAINGSNPWWSGAFEFDYKERNIYNEIQKFINLPQIISLTGLRRTGKSTLMRKIIKDYLASGFEAQNILYFSFDDFETSELEDILSEYENITGKNIEIGKYLLLFDEIQKLNKWEEKIKRIYDRYYKKAKIIISGSESLFIRKKSKESLAGRIFEFKVEQLTFDEFIRIKGAKIKPIAIYENKLIKLFDEYTLTMGFPELVDVNDKQVIRRYIRDLIEKIIDSDIPKVFNVEDPQILKSMLNILMDNPGQIINVSEISKELGIERHACSRYFSFLEASFLIKKLYNFSKNKRKIERKLKKYYPTVISPELSFQDDQFSRSKVFEWSLVRQINPEFFWRDAYKNEVDMVVTKGMIIPIEIKYGKIDINGTLEFLRKFGLNEGYIISRNTESQKMIDGKNITIIPFFKFLLSYQKVYKGASDL
jgi:predicted AAA+ superfamily ATPase